MLQSYFLLPLEYSRRKLYKCAPLVMFTTRVLYINYTALQIWRERVFYSACCFCHLYRRESSERRQKPLQNCVILFSWFKSQSLYHAHLHPHTLCTHSNSLLQMSYFYSISQTSSFQSLSFCLVCITLYSVLSIFSYGFKILVLSQVILSKLILLYLIVIKVI